MGIAVNKDGEIVLTLDDDYNLSTDALRTLGLGSYGANKNTPGGTLKNSDMAPFIFPEGTNNDLKLYLDNLAEKTNITPDVPKPKTDDELREIELKKLERLTDPKNFLDDLKDKTIDPIKEFIMEEIPEAFANADGNDLIKKLLPDSYMEDIISKMPKLDGVPGSGEELNLADMFKILAKDKRDKRAEEERMTFPEKIIEAAAGSDLEENAISNTEVKNEKKEKKVDKTENKKPAPEKDDRTKIGKIMDGLLNKDEFLMDLGLRLMDGEGLFPSAIKASKTQKESDAADKKAELEALELDSKLNYNSALANQAEAYAEKAGLPSEKIQEANAFSIAKAAKAGEPGTPEFNAAYATAFTGYLNNAKDASNPFLRNIDDAFMFEMLKDRFPELQNYVNNSSAGTTTAGSTGVDSPVGPIELNINDYLNN